MAMNPGKTSERRAAHLARLASAKVKHGLCDHPLYMVWGSMKARCNNPNNKSFADYGGRGITVCAEWMDEFSAFFGWANNSGWERGLHIDRIDTNGAYSPQNCRFVTQANNNRNRRNTQLSAQTVKAVYAAEGTHISVSQRFGVPYSVAAKIRSGRTYSDITKGEEA